MKWMIAVCAFILLAFPVLAATPDTIVARGDTINFTVDSNASSIWLFSTAGLDYLYDIPCAGNNTITLTDKQSASLEPGTYIGVIQYAGANGIKEVSYAERYNKTTWTDTNPVIDRFLVSPFKSVPDVEINGMLPSLVEQKMYEVAKKSGDILGGGDDIFNKTVIEVQEPLTAINEIGQIDDDEVYIYGKSNLQVGTPLKIVWDAERLVSASDYKLNTFTTYVKEDNITLQRYFEFKIRVRLQELPAGVHWVEVIANDKITRYKYNVGEIWQDQEPPPMQKIKYLNDGVIVTPTPEIVQVTVTVPVDRTVIQTVVIPTQPFPKDALGTEYDPTKVPNMNWLAVPVVGLLVGMMIMLRGAKK